MLFRPQHAMHRVAGVLAGRRRANALPACHWRQGGRARAVHSTNLRGGHARALLVVSEGLGERLQVLTLTGVPLQVMTFTRLLIGLCADEQRVWVSCPVRTKYTGSHQVHELLLPLRS